MSGIVEGADTLIGLGARVASPPVGPRVAFGASAFGPLPFRRRRGCPGQTPRCVRATPEPPPGRSEGKALPREQTRGRDVISADVQREGRVWGGGLLPR